MIVIVTIAYDRHCDDRNSCIIQATRLTEALFSGGPSQKMSGRQIDRGQPVHQPPLHLPTSPHRRRLQLDEAGRLDVHQRPLGRHRRLPKHKAGHALCPPPVPKSR